LPFTRGDKSEEFSKLEMSLACNIKLIHHYACDDLEWAFLTLGAEALNRAPIEGGAPKIERG
jgi:hypothetical protein